MLLCTNDLPKLDGHEDAIVRRLIALNFPMKYTSKPDKSNPLHRKADQTLKSRLKDPTSSLTRALQGWAVEGAKAWYALRD